MCSIGQVDDRELYLIVWENDLVARFLTFENNNISRYLLYLLTVPTYIIYLQYLTTVPTYWKET